jgi:hypothetical protein
VDLGIKLHQGFFQLGGHYCPHFTLEKNISVIRQVFISSFSVVSKSCSGRCWDATLNMQQTHISVLLVLLTVHLVMIFVNNQLDAQFFFMYVYFYSLHVSGSHVPIIRRINPINAELNPI